MKESIQNRIDRIMSAETTEELRECVCPFFEKGGSPECVTCRKEECDVEECRDYYLERITLIPLDLWSEEFDKFITLNRDKIPVKEVSGIGINCNSCYMSGKCPLFKKNYSCGINWGDSKPSSPSEFLDFLIDVQYERVKRSSVFEKVDGGVPDANLSGEMDRLQRFIYSKLDMGRDRLSISVEASGSAAPATGGGILAKLFGGGGTTALPDKKTEIPAKPESMKDIIDIQDAVELKPEPVKVSRQRKK